MPVPIEIKTALDEIRALALANPQLVALQKQVDAIDVKLAGGGGHFGGEEQRSLSNVFDEDDGLQRLIKDKRGKAAVHLKGADALLLQRKTTITSGTVGAATSGVLQIGRLGEITSEARQQLTLRDLLTATPTTFQVIDFVKVATPMSPASPAPEATTKAENQQTFATVSERVKTIATFIPASRQVLDDMNGLVAFINNSLTYYLNLEEELQLLSGDATGENLHGLIPQATAFSVGLLSALHGWNKIDIIGRAIEQITASKELPPTFVLLHPTDWWDIRLQKDGFGRYILGDPQQGSLAAVGFGVVNPTQDLFGLAVVPTTNISQGQFLVGSGSPVAAEILDRLETIIEISTETGNNFIQNLVTIRAEKRLALITRRPASFVTGTFNTSP